jgi:thiamine biosynthesis lipoprotein
MMKKNQGALRRTQDKMPDPFDSTRREFLTGRTLQKEVERTGSAMTEELLKELSREAPVGGNTVRLTTEAMACEFSVVMNQGASRHLMTAAEALEIIHTLEAQMTVYRDDSELSRLNTSAFGQAIPVEPELFRLLLKTKEIWQDTEGAFDPTSGPLIALWRQCRSDGRIPAQAEIAEALSHTGMRHIQFDEAHLTIQFDDPLTEFNLGAIGKGYALDRARVVLDEAGIEDWLFHGGFSSIVAKGRHQGQAGWPVGIRNPLLPHETLGTILLKDQALSTSGSGVQSFRIGGNKYGHILDPRTGWPVEELLSVTVLAPTATQAEALSTAFFVLGLEKTRNYCDNHPDVSCLLIPPPDRGRALMPINCGLPEDVLFLETTPPPNAQ